MNPDELPDFFESLQDVLSSSANRHPARLTGLAIGFEAAWRGLTGEPHETMTDLLRIRTLVDTFSEI